MVRGEFPLFEDELPFARPTLPLPETLFNGIKDIILSGIITNGKYVSEFEKRIATYLEVKEAIAVSSATTGLMLVINALKLKGEVIIPANTFAATAHAVVWAGLKPVLVDCELTTGNISPEKVIEAITPSTTAIMGVHLYGNPCDLSKLEEIKKKFGLKLIIDAAHAMGAIYNGTMVGIQGDAHIFSLSPTKLLSVGEGGMITTNDEMLADLLRINRNYGLQPGEVDAIMIGLNGRMEEFNALLGLEGMKLLEENVIRRNNLAKFYIEGLSLLPGITFQTIESGCRSTYKDMAIFIDPVQFGLDRNFLAHVLQKEHIPTRKYFYPSIHLLKVYRDDFKEYDGKLPHTERLSSTTLSLPLYSHMKEEDIIKVCEGIKSAHLYQKELVSSY